MALEGTIKDFGLADIFQLIGIHRRTGVLTIDGEEDRVIVKFIDGSVVGADTDGSNLEDRLGAVLVRSGRIAQPQLDAALDTQRKTLQRLGFILVDSSAISSEDLKEALQIQVTQIVYRLFRWKDGSFRFDSRDQIDYDRNFTPISAETILMEGARMVDEWPIIERRIHSDDMVFRKTGAARELDLPVESIVEADIDVHSIFEERKHGTEEAGDEEIRLSPEERAILRLVNGRFTVQEVADRSTLGEFDTYRILCELLTRNLIEEVESARPESPERGRSNAPARIAAALATAVVFGAAAVGIATLAWNPVVPWGIVQRSDDADRLRTFASRSRLETIERALELFFLDTGLFPEHLRALADNAYLSEEALLDPWGRPYRYRLDSGGYTLVGLNAQGLPEEGLTLIRRFSPSQLMLLGEEVQALAPAAKSPPRLDTPRRSS